MKLNEYAKQAIEAYQCPGCVGGSDTECYERGNHGITCSGHVAGTCITPYVGHVFLGMPKGFNRLGPIGHAMKIIIYRAFDGLIDEWGKLDKFNVPVWKMLLNGHTFIRGLAPRVNYPFLIVVLEDCMDKINCLEITAKDLEEMD